MSFYKLIFLIPVFILCSCGGEKPAEDRESEVVADNTTESTPVPAEEPESTEPHPGKKVYDQYCTVCHQADGKGVPNAFPPLNRTEWVLGDTDRLIGVVLNGLTGEIEVNGEKYNSAMTPHNFLTDQEVADVITYVRSNFGNDGEAVTAEQVAVVRGGS